MTEADLDKLVSQANGDDTTAQSVLWDALSTVDDPDGLLRLAERHYGSEVALLLLRRAVQLVPTNADALASLAESYAIQDDCRSAKSLAEQALRLNGRQVLARYVLLVCAEDASSKLTIADEILTADPTYYSAIRAKAEALVALRRKEDGLSVLRNYIDSLEQDSDSKSHELAAARATLRHLANTK